MARWQSPPIGCVGTLAVILGLAVGVPAAGAQPPASNPSHMCGTGESFTVNLPGTSLGIDDTDGTWRNIDVPEEARADSVTLPKGCRIYAFLISGFGDNAEYDQIIFYKVAEFVAQNNGYVHVGWWNNLTKPYMEQPLHQETITIQKTLFGFPIGDPVNIFPTPKTEGVPDTFLNTGLDLPKANPDEDYQFLSDADVVLNAVREHNPNALIIVAGHSMGGNAVARLGTRSGVPIDLLALIDPVGNRDMPRGLVGQKNFNWTRWRAAVEFQGYKDWDCVRNALGLCKNTSTSLFGISFTCTTTGSAWYQVKPLIGTLAPLACPKSSYVDPGTRMTIRANVRYLYHRWQLESPWPVDFLSTELFNRPRGFPPVSTTDILSTNYQAPVLKHLTPFVANDPNKTCSFGADPRDENFQCHPGDGHGEIIGVRVDPTNPNSIAARMRPGMRLTNWLPRSLISFTPGERRERLIQLAADGPAWPYRPVNPDLCLVCDDIIAITQHLMGQQPQETEMDTVAPASDATRTPDANPAGWANEDVVVSVKAADDRSAVEEISLTLSGAQVGSTATPGSSVEVVINTEGLTTVSFFASDEAGNIEQPAHTLDVRIDKTPPDIEALTDILANDAGWHRSPVVVSFPASDSAEGSGLLASSPSVIIGTEGAAQVVTGEAEDIAGNVRTAPVTLNIDLTPPEMTLDSRAPAANAAGWNKTAVAVTWNCTDALSGPVAATDSVALGSEGAAQSATGNCLDFADHVTTGTVAGINIDMTAPLIAAVPDIPANARGWHKTDVVVRFEASDALSGIASSTPDVQVSTETAGQVFKGLAEDGAGNTNDASLLLKIDKTPPQITAARDIEPNGFGWNNTDVRVSFAASDALSGLAFTPPDTVVSSEGAGQTIVGDAYDNADNTNNVSVILNIDKTPPQVSAAADIAPNVHGWNRGDVRVSFAVSDALSGVASTPPDVIVSTEGAAQRIERVGTDKAGNSETGSLVLNIDNSAPIIGLISRTPAPNAAGWNNTDVTVSWSCHDALSGAIVTEVSGVAGGEGPAQSATGQCSDRAGNTASDAQSAKIDKTSPVSQITTPGEGATYLLNAVVNASYGCSDALSGVNACIGPVAHGAALDTATVGAKTFTVTSADVAGNHGTMSHSYAVQYAFSGFANPIAVMPALNVANAGRTVPVKYALRDANGAAISDLTSFVSLMSAPIACDSNVPSADAEQTDAPGSTAIVFDSGLFHYNWKTSAAWQGTCRVLQLTLQDGTRHMAAFQFK
jgi:hypothetical protein